MIGFGWLKRKPEVDPNEPTITAVSVRRPELGDLFTGEPVKVSYCNWRGEIAERSILPKHIWFGVTAFHPDTPQILVHALDMERGVTRDFAWADMVLLP